MSQIPTMSRIQVRVRDKQSCVRCGVGLQEGQWHHRRTRSIRDDHQHCPCNGVWLCLTCHAWAHANPFEARAEGLIISRFKDTPFTEPFKRWDGAWFQPDCTGSGAIVPGN